MSKPLLSIGIIFKNEIRCLERCMRSLAPLREAVPCELVMADTGSTDGSREIAEKYADILFDFPWVNDFSAARNAVLERCSGIWHFQIDADEWFDEDISQLLGFLRSPREREKYGLGVVTIRSYVRKDLTGDYSDFLGIRLMLLSTGNRYEGAIHEHPAKTGGRITCNLALTVLHHDGYVDLGEEQGRAKRERNMSLLVKELEKNPDDLRTRLHCFESSYGAERETYIRLALEGVEAHLKGWRIWGPTIYRYAVSTASERDLPELDAWAARAKELFPDSLYTTVDVAYCFFISLVERGRYAEAVPEGEGYLCALDNYRNTRSGVTQLSTGGLAMIAPLREDMARIFLAEAYYRTGRYDDAQALLTALDGARLNGQCVNNYVEVLLHLQSDSGLELGPAMCRLWKQIISPLPTPAMADERVQAVAAAARPTFDPRFRELEDKEGLRHGYTLFLPLAGICSLGDTAQRIDLENSPAALAERLAAVEDWSQLDPGVLARALKCGVTFPPSGSPLFKVEESDLLAARLGEENPELLLELALSAEWSEEDWQSLSWSRALILAAVQSCVWKQQDEQSGVVLVQKFAALEKAWLPLYYAPGVLTEEKIALLPPLHRFGWYCGRAFEALETGEMREYIHLLREGLSCSGCLEGMAEFLLEHAGAVRNAMASAELRALADGVRTLLTRLPPDNPAVAALKESEQYRRVAWLIGE